MIPAYQVGYEPALERYFKTEFREDWEVELNQYLDTQRAQQRLARRNRWLVLWNQIIDFVGFTQKKSMEHFLAQAQDPADVERLQRMLDPRMHRTV